MQKETDLSNQLSSFMAAQLSMSDGDEMDDELNQEDDSNIYYIKEILDLKTEHNKIGARLDNLKSDIQRTVALLTKNYRSFEKNFINTVESSKSILKKKMTSLFTLLLKEKLPGVYLRSIPKFGGSNLSNIMHATLLEMKRRTEKTGQLVSINFSRELIDEISLLMEIVDNFIRDPREIIENLIKNLENSIYKIRDEIDKLEDCLFSSHNQNERFIEKLISMKKSIKRKIIDEDNLKLRFKTKDEKMDVLREEIKKYNGLLEEQRRQFYKELINVKMKLYEKKEKNIQVSKNDIPVGNFTLNYIQGNKNKEKNGNDENGKDSSATSQIEFVIKVNMKIANLQKNFLIQKDEMEKKNKKIMDEKSVQIEELNIKIDELTETIQNLKEEQKNEKKKINSFDELF